MNSASVARRAASSRSSTERPIGRQHPQRAAIELEQHLDFPVVEHARPDRRQIGTRHQRQQLQPLRRADFLGKSRHQLRLRRIAPKRQVRHQQMLVHQELERLGFFRR